ncbi:MAG TPA: SPFH domain-containing protein [Pseudorhodoplanes sp.]|nr:SPFH domain-containing protein [Pseudorhodoplanes sp.]
MFTIFLAIVVLIAAAVGGTMIRQRVQDDQSGARLSRAVWVLGILAAAVLMSMTSWVNVGKFDTAHLVKVYGGARLPAGQIIAVEGEKGPQAQVLGPGFHISPLIRVINNIETHPIIEIEEGKAGFLVAKDGRPLRPNQFIADAWPAGKDMLDAEVFLRNGGQKGPQLNILPPGQYRINTFLWDVKTAAATNIAEGHVGVIKSNVQGPVEFGNLVRKMPDVCWQQKVTAKTEGGIPEPVADEGRLTAVLVPVGCVGVWDTALNPGRYYINTRAYQVTEVDTRVQTWEYKGGYPFRQIDLVVDDNGQITQKETTTNRPVPKEAADQAVFPRIEGWTVPIELRVLVQVTAENAPFVVASVGGIREIEDRIMTPSIRSVVRNVLGQEGRKVLEVAENRGNLEQEVETAIKPEGLKAGVVIKEIRFGDPAIPPELLVSRLRQQLASQLQETFRQERIAQSERIARERERATATQQPEFVRAEIGVKVAEENKKAALLRGEGQKLELQEVAAGQKAQAQVLGEDKVLIITLAKEVLKTLETKPELVGLIGKLVPNTVVTGSGGFDLSAAAAVLRGTEAPAGPPAPAPRR